MALNNNATTIHFEVQFLEINPKINNLPLTSHVVDDLQDFVRHKDEEQT